ncbi:MAG: DNA repair protein RecN [Ruminococcus sp.]|nr:DNA repair protein RecN [Ruminococcus sp.]
MLRELYIENLAVIEKASIDFCENFNVFTGETGAGKSILINGINAVLGQRIQKDIVRSGEKKANVTAVFYKLSREARAILEENGIETEDGELMISREIRSDGGSVARINSRPVNVSLLRELGQTLVNIHGQHDNQILMSPEKHIGILDDYADLNEETARYREEFHKLQSMARKLKELKNNDTKKVFRINELQEIISEIDSLDIKPNEDEEIEKELDISKNAVIISEAIFKARALLKGTDDEVGSALMVTDAANELMPQTDIMSELSPLVERLESAAIELDDIALELSSAADKLDVDPKRYEYLNERFSQLRRIKKKYGPELDDVIKLLESSKAELDTLLNSEQDINGLEALMKEQLSGVTQMAKDISAKRKAAAERFTSQVVGELEFLNMPNVKIVVSQQTGKLTINGLDTIEFLISANLGEEPKPIAKIASGGELSRIMLALKSVIAEKDSIDTLIFDEIDTGVSGRAAQKIGHKLREISRSRQVICVTHLSQIAVMADEHLLIEKNEIDGRTVTSVKPLDDEGRKLEIARIMGGDNIDELMLENAENLLNSYK